MQNEEIKKLARTISLVENESDGYERLLAGIAAKDVPVIGITGSPGAGKSTLINALISNLTAQGKKLAILAIDPTSPFNLGSLLGDRIRMAEHYTNPNVYIRSLATRGSLGGLSAKTIEITDILKSFDFDYIIIETVGVGQSEVEISGLADCTLLVLVPEGGDEIQALKSGIMEIADIFVVNKCDRPGANTFITNLKKLIPERHLSENPIPVIGTSANQNTGIEELIQAIETHLHSPIQNSRKSLLLAEKAYQLILRKRMKDINKRAMSEEIKGLMAKGDFNLYEYVENK